MPGHEASGLAAVEPGTTEAADLWAEYLRRWTRSNTARTALGVVSTLLFALVLAVG